MTLEQAAKLLKVLQDAYPREPLSEDSLELYARMLLDIPEAVGRQAVVSLIASLPYPTMPTIGEIRQAAARILLHAPSPAEAMAEVREQVRAHGIYGTPTFSHPAIRRAVEAVGWRNLCMTEEPEVMYGQLLRVYQAVVESWTAALQDPVQGERRQAVLQALGLPTALEEIPGLPPAMASQEQPHAIVRRRR